MIDYADSIGSKQGDLTKSKTASSAIVPLPHLVITLILAGFIYILGYQNSTIAQVKHNVNMKKNKLIELKLTVDNLRLQREKLFNSKHILSEIDSKNLKIAKADNIQIIH